MDERGKYIIAMNFLKDRHVKNAILIGGLCSVSYLGVYVVRNIFGTVTPQLLGENGVTAAYIGEVSSLYFIAYAVGQLINGIAGDKIKARYMISLGLMLAGVCNWVFPDVLHDASMAKIVYSLSGFFLSMIYAPMTKLVAENTKPLYAVRCSMGYSFASMLGSPSAGVLSTFLAWEQVFKVGGVVISVMGVFCLVVFGHMEKVSIIRYNQYDRPKQEKQKNGIKILIQHQIIKFTMISILTGVVRTTVIFWLPTYLAQYLGFSTSWSATIFSVVTLVTSTITFISIFIYERLLKRNMNLTILLAFSTASLSFLGVYAIASPIPNILLMVLGIMGSEIASSMLWSRYCPSLRDTGMTATATGFLDFVSYMAAAAASTLFANAVSSVGWGNLILIWVGLMLVGVLVSVPIRKKVNRYNTVF